jgi:hypothetical protein
LGLGTGRVEGQEGLGLRNGLCLSLLSQGWMQTTPVYSETLGATWVIGLFDSRNLGPQITAWH